MAKKKQQTITEQPTIEQTQQSVVSDNVTEATAPDVSSSVTPVSSTSGVELNADATFEPQQDEVAKAISEEQTSSAAATVALDSDPVALPLDAVEKKPEEGLCH